MIRSEERRKAERSQGASVADTGVIARAFAVLRAFDSQGTRLSNREISERAGLPPSTVSRVTFALLRTGYLAYVEQERKYRLGANALVLVSSLSRQIDHRQIIQAELKKLAQEFPGIFGFMARDDAHMIYLEHLNSRNLVGLQTAVGSRVPIGSTACGHAFMAAISERESDALMEQLEKKTPHEAKLIRPRLKKNRRHLSEHGYVVVCGLWNRYINACAVPIWSNHFQTYLVLTVGILASLYDETSLHKKVAPRMLELRDYLAKVSAPMSSDIVASASTDDSIRKKSARVKRSK